MNAPATNCRSGPLTGVRIVEFAGQGPGPFCGMLLSDLGADVIRIDRADARSVPLTGYDVMHRGRRSVALNLKSPAAIEACLRLIASADALIEGYRPGVMERLGLGPDTVLARNPKLAYGRMTGWGQDGPLAQSAGHDINYIALTGALHAIGSRERPEVPLNLVGDLGGGALYLAMGLLAAMLHARRTGEGQVVDSSIVDGVCSMMTPFFGGLSSRLWTDQRAVNGLDGGAHYYGVYECADGQWVSVGSMESQFYAQLIETLGLDPAEFEAQHSKKRWPEFKCKIAAAFRTRTRDEWCTMMEGSEACFAPVLSLSEVPKHPHHLARKTFVEIDGIVQPGPAPRFSRTPGSIQRPAPTLGADTEAALRDWGFDDDDLDMLSASGALGPTRSKRFDRLRASE